MEQLHSFISSPTSTKQSNLKIVESVESRSSSINGIWSKKSLVDPVDTNGYLVKRLIDYCFSVLFLLITCPFFLAIAVAIKLDSAGPIFFKETRMGLRGQKFKIWKFRTMQANAEKLQRELEHLNETKDGVNFKIKNDPRITRTGKFLRRYSLDELPQMFNVICGDMSLVGPRPFNMRDVSNFAEHYFVRYDVLPGITGLWQVSGRSNILEFEKVIQLDVQYIKQWSIWLDFKILMRTIKVVFSQEGAY